MRSGFYGVIMILLALCAPAWAYDWTTNPGDGSPENPYQISEPNQLIAIGANPDLLDKNFILTNDIIFDPNNNPEHVFEKALIGGWGIESYGLVTVFNGMFQGNNKSIRNLKMSSQEMTSLEYLGLFYAIGQSGIVENLNLVNVEITALDATVGALAERNDGTIRSCNVQTAMTGSITGGGLVFVNNGTIEACQTMVSMDLTYVSCAGGLVGENSGTLSNCSSSGHITGPTDNYPYFQYLGGCIGLNEGRVTACRSDVNLVGAASIGGFAGATGPGSVIVGCYANGNVSGEWAVGGFVGESGQNSEIITCYSTGKVTPIGGDNDYISGFASYNEGTIYLCYWDTQSSQIVQSQGGIGKTTAEMKSLDTFVGWGYDDVWVMDPGNDYPRLKWENTTGNRIADAPYTYGGGDGTIENPFVISTAEHLRAIGLYRQDFDKHFVLADNIELTVPADPNTESANFNIIGTLACPFTGTFDGQGHSIINLYSTVTNQNEYVGLFGCVESVGSQSGTITNLLLQSPHLKGGRFVGGIAGQLTGGEISYCGVRSGYINTWDCAGGLVGKNTGGKLIRCFSDAAIDWEERYLYTGFGGLVGLNDDGIIDSCYARGTMLALQGGGLVGLNRNGAIVTSFSAVVPSSGEIDFKGLVYSDEATCGYFLSYWDKQLSGISSSEGGEGKTTAELMNRQTFDGWGDDAWVLDNGNDYPHLAWEATEGQAIVDVPRTYGGGSGTLNDPYQIWDADQINTLSHYRNDFDKHYILMDDIVLQSIETFPLENYQPIGIKGVPFCGTFDGNEKTLEGLFYQGGKSCIGLFGHIHGANGDTPVVKDLKLSRVYIETEGDYAGALAGAIEDGMIRNCSVQYGFYHGFSYDLMVSGNNNVGGLAGLLRSATLENCRVSSGQITGVNQTGGLVGTIENSRVNACTFNGELEGNEQVGGLVGWLASGVVSNCSTFGTIDGFNMVGGLAGRSGSGEIIVTTSTITSIGISPGVEEENNEIRRSRFEGNVRGDCSCGGFVGVHSWGNIAECSVDATVYATQKYGGGLTGCLINGTVINSYADVDLEGKSDSGGLCGLLFNGDIVHCYCVGMVNGYEGSAVPDAFIGDVWETMMVDSCYFSETLGVAENGGTPLTETQMKHRTSFVGWDFLGESTNGDNEIWRMCVDGVDYPRLSWEFAKNGDFACGDGVGLEDLQALAENWLAASEIEPETFNYAADANGDEQIDLSDFNILSENWK